MSVALKLETTVPDPMPLVRGIKRMKATGFRSDARLLAVGEALYGYRCLVSAKGMRYTNASRSRSRNSQLLKRLKSSHRRRR